LEAIPIELEWNRSASCSAKSENTGFGMDSRGVALPRAIRVNANPLPADLCLNLRLHGQYGIRNAYT